MIMAVVAAPQTKDSSIKSAAMAGIVRPKIKSSAALESRPVIWDVYSPTARNPPAFNAPAIQHKVTPKCKFAFGLRFGEVSLAK